MEKTLLKNSAETAYGRAVCAGEAAQRIRVTGLVQGVGFRPFVWRLAKELDLRGWVRNDANGVDIEAAGSAPALDGLISRLRSDAPPAARIDGLTVRDAPPRVIADDFFILNSRTGRQAMVGADSAVCRDCLAEMFDPGHRRWRYAFTACAQCGPRYTLCRALPYTRERTSYKGFAPCSKCQGEAGREASAPPTIACPKCGPQLSLVDATGAPIGGDAVKGALALLQSGRILAVKSVGGFQLLVDARNAQAVATLRQRRGDDVKPFALMLANATSASAYVQLGVGEPGLLSIPERPVILLKKRRSCDAALSGVAPGLGWLGVTLPATPLDYLLFHEAAARPAGVDWLQSAQPLALAVGAANADGEPPLVANDDALHRLAGVADAFLLHDLEIVTPCDATIARSGPGGLRLIRRGRGYAPRAIKLARSGPPVLAVGGKVQNTVCLCSGDDAFVSQHLGDLDRPAAKAYFENTVAQLMRLLEARPALIVHDLDADLPASRFAADLAHHRGVPLLAVQHHHALVASVLAEHQLSGPVVALALDRLALGADAPCGGGLLRVDGLAWTQAGALRPLPALPATSARGPRALAASVLCALGRADEIGRRFGAGPGVPVVDAAPAAASLACYISAAAGLLGVEETFDGQAALALEALAEGHGEMAPLAGGFVIDATGLDLLPLFAVLADEKDAARGAALFHATLVAALGEWVGAIAPTQGTVVGAGGCLLNLSLARGLRAKLAARGLPFLEARKLPANDAGISLGQAWLGQQYLLG